MFCPYLPLGQAMHSFDPGSAYVPILQTLQKTAADSFWNSPGPQSSQTTWPPSSWNFPGRALLREDSHSFRYPSCNVDMATIGAFDKAGCPVQATTDNLGHSTCKSQEASGFVPRVY
eukprot:scaffold1552_cov165-Pinguiococcus_pyrenoidosus.AAC.4